MKTCQRCGIEYPDIFFGRDHFEKYTSRKSSRRVICIGCTQAERDKRKQVDRSSVKAATAITHHAEVFIKRGVISNRKELVIMYGWDVKQMKHDIEHAFINSCPYCSRPFSEMPYGLSDLTLDIINPNDPPYYKSNTRWVCMTCNREKSKTPPDKWGEKLRCWALWRKHQEEILNNEWHGTLFAPLKYTSQLELS